MENKKKYKVNFTLMCADYYYTTKNGTEMVNRFTLFVDSKGIYIITKNGVEFLTEENSEVV